MGLAVCVQHFSSLRPRPLGVSSIWFGFRAEGSGYLVTGVKRRNPNPKP